MFAGKRQGFFTPIQFGDLYRSVLNFLFSFPKPYFSRASRRRIKAGFEGRMPVPRQIGFRKRKQNQETGSFKNSWYILVGIIFSFFTSLKSFAEDSLPPVTDYVEKLNNLHEFLVGVSAGACVLVIFAFVYFAIRYRRKSEDETGHATTSHSFILEFTWSFIPFLIFAVAFVWGWILYYDLRTPPEDSLEVHAYGQMWSWDFVYKNGRKTTNELYVPKDKPVKLIMTSRDVLHSFYIPTFKIKQDVVPGMYTSLWFKANRKGKFQVFCAEFCGTGHSVMLAKVNVVSLEEWEAWLENDPYKGLTLKEIGEKAFQGRCVVCHKPTKEKYIGPGLAGVYGSRREFSNAAPLTADENYLRESILNPADKIVMGFTNAMTPFAGALSEEELSGLIEYIKELK